MIRLLQPSDRQLILDYVYAAEKENMFIIGSFNRPEPFENNVYLGSFTNDLLVGLGTFFKRFGSLVVHAHDEEVLRNVTNYFGERKVPIEFVPAFKKYATPTIEALRHFGYEPTEIADQTVFLLTSDSFTDHSDESTALATEQDIDEIIRLQWAADEEDPHQEITEKDRRQILIDSEFITKLDGKIISSANVQGVSEHYIQIGGVATHPDYQGKGYAKRTVSAVCRYWMARGKHVLLFCRNENVAALKVYAALGFQSIDEFVIGVYNV